MTGLGFINWNKTSSYLLGVKKKTGLVSLRVLSLQSSTAAAFAVPLTGIESKNMTGDIVFCKNWYSKKKLKPRRQIKILALLISSFQNFRRAFRPVIFIWEPSIPGMDQWDVRAMCIFPGTFLVVKKITNWGDLSSQWENYTKQVLSY